VGLGDPAARWAAARRPRGPTPGFTLAEIVVVLVVLGLAAALVAPALIPPQREAPASLTAVIEHVQDMAARRGETLVLEVSANGSWRVVGTAAIDEGPLEAGALSEQGDLGGFALRVAPLGSCGPTLDGDPGDTGPALDLLTCRVVLQ
jgi:prepilin-type N-terminal cleavage/methylation domain-containing protein